MSEDKQSSGGFFTGLLFGAVAGAAGYFFLKTDEGKKAKDRLMEEWEKAKMELAKNDTVKDVTQSLPEPLQDTIKHVIEPKRLVKTTTIKRPPKKIEAPKKKEEVKKFKGTK